MAISPPPVDTATLARVYIQSLQGGYMGPHPDTPEYERLFQTLDHMYRRSKGNMQSFLDGIKRMAQTDPQLAELLNTTPVVEVPAKPILETVVSEDTVRMPALPELAYLDSQGGIDACPWLNDYIAYSQQVSPESYKDFHPFTGLFALSTIAARRIYIPMGPDGIFPSLAISFTGRSSLFAKTMAVKVGLKVIRASGLSWLLGDDETTPQKLLSDMAGQSIPTKYSDLGYYEQEDIRRRLSMSGQRGWFYDEFGQVVASMAKQSGPMADFVGLFRKLDGSPETYSYSTRSFGREVIQKPYLSFLGNMTPDDIKPYASKGNAFWGNGFWARFIHITPPIGSDIDKDFELGDIPVPYDLHNTLREWNKRLGVPDCKIDPIIEKDKETGRYTIEREDLPQTQILADQDALQAWSRYRKALKQIMRKSTNHDLDGSYQRLSDKALRIAILFASLDGSNRISLKHWTLAQQYAELIRENLHELYRQVNVAPESESQEIEQELLAYMHKQENPVSGRTIRQFGPNKIRKMPIEKFTSMLRSLSTSNMLEMNRVGKEVMYYLPHNKDEDIP